LGGTITGDWVAKQAKFTGDWVAKQLIIQLKKNNYHFQPDVDENKRLKKTEFATLTLAKFFDRCAGNSEKRN
jgi:hypothetical protein